ncbi:hypothetical protein [Streptomyces sp. NBC_01431]|uniref:hypothetical protein n=1 Tax=Streptomyces sp. NBC_01431 TaxID=2903863 RepID=UPI002E305490|nr:hypothetical protein [Streptomyces sp. NBC_01431]
MRSTTVLSPAVLGGAAITAATGTASAASGASCISQGQNTYAVDPSNSQPMSTC